MREIDPIREPSEALLAAALHRLASSSPDGAPEEVGNRLAGAFRRHHARRRRVRMAFLGSVAAAVVMAAAFKLATRPASPTYTTAKAPDVTRQIEAKENRPRVQGPARQEPSGARHQRRESRANAQAIPSAEGNFIALHLYDASMATGDLQVVRVSLTGADLRLVGAPVTEEASDRRLLADIVVGPDGTPYAVRLVSQ